MLISDWETVVIGDSKTVVIGHWKTAVISDCSIGNSGDQWSVTGKIDYSEVLHCLELHTDDESREHIIYQQLWCEMESSTVTVICSEIYKRSNEKITLGLGVWHNCTFEVIRVIIYFQFDLYMFLDVAIWGNNFHPSGITQSDLDLQGVWEESVMI